jgi:hypothetical protein
MYQESPSLWKHPDVDSRTRGEAGGLTDGRVVSVVVLAHPLGEDSGLV